MSSGPLKSLAIEANHVAARASDLAVFARELEFALIGSRPEKSGDAQARVIPPRETFAEQLNGALHDTLEAINAIEVSVSRIREAL